MARGNYLSPKQKVEADVPQVLNALEAGMAKEPSWLG